MHVQLATASCVLGACSGDEVVDRCSCGVNTTDDNVTCCVVALATSSAVALASNWRGFADRPIEQLPWRLTRYRPNGVATAL